jgi:hypothetical protein
VRFIYRFKISIIKFNKLLLKDKEYIGCYEARNGLNVFLESINSTQCTMGANFYSTFTSSFFCYIGGYHNFIDSELMTIEICIDICISKSGFLYAGISRYIFEK